MMKLMPALYPLAITANLMDNQGTKNHISVSNQIGNKILELVKIYFIPQNYTLGERAVLKKSCHRGSSTNKLCLGISCG